MTTRVKTDDISCYTSLNRVSSIMLACVQLMTRMTRSSHLWLHSCVYRLCSHSVFTFTAKNYLSLKAAPQQTDNVARKNSFYVHCCRITYKCVFASVHPQLFEKPTKSFVSKEPSRETIIWSLLKLILLVKHSPY